ncbi:hypothetical protein [Pedomonas mirosovicensis]|uniref:hypothetical protein n=1 Tax=Pedomonas mirosovicensis TaxID=2908641 RepID=UPI00216A70AE|nr:hypothetical protein [Pedomonas mirosovicensis]MCH8686064.1 hypothetical protein [Pedomonas mirosovicensis]
MATLTAAGFVYRAVDRGSFSNLQDGRAYESWVEWQLGRVHGIEAVALAGTLAPSNFNTQPWLIRVYDNTIDLFFNHHSYTALLDPFNRVALMGLGACIENMVVGARGLGHPASVTLFPNGPADDTVARLSLGSAPLRKRPTFTPLPGGTPTAAPMIHTACLRRRRSRPCKASRLVARFALTYSPPIPKRANILPRAPLLRPRRP